MATINSTYNQILNPTPKCWKWIVVCNEQVKPFGVTYYDNKHDEKSVRLRLKDKIVQEIDY